MLLTAALLALPGCVLVDGPFLALRSVAGGIHNKRQVSGVRPFFLPDGRLGAAVNGALVLEETPGGALVEIRPTHAEIDDPDASPDGRWLACVSGAEQVTAGGGHNDHVFQLYLLDLAGGGVRRVTRSRRAEAWPRFTRDGQRLVYARRAEYAGWSLDDPWGPAALFVAESDGTGERRLTEPLAHPLLGLALADDDARVVFAAMAEGAAVPALFMLDLPQSGAPRRLAENAYLPVALDGTGELLVARAYADGHGLAVLGPDGSTRAEQPLGLNPLVGLARAADGARLALADLAPEDGTFGEYRLWALAPGQARPVLRARYPYRLERAFKPLDVVKPPSWWFRPDASPGSR